MLRTNGFFRYPGIALWGNHRPSVRGPFHFPYMAHHHGIRYIDPGYPFRQSGLGGKVPFATGIILEYGTVGEPDPSGMAGKLVGMGEHGPTLGPLGHVLPFDRLVGTQ